MRFFSKLTFICNICFILAVILRFVEFKRRATGNLNNAIKFQPLEATVAILGYGAIFLNAVFFLFGIYWLLKKKIRSTPTWIFVCNLILFPLQVYYFLFTS